MSRLLSRVAISQIYPIGRTYLYQFSLKQIVKHEQSNPARELVHVTRE